MEDWKQLIGEQALQSGIINDPQWLDRLDESMPVWAVLKLFLEFIEKHEAHYNSYD
ncbi:MULTISPECIES: hypothetical protein [Paenibacillus]|uniref:Uncharacterized protein n=1 Tax=Paenibacillus radicis (ex Xue et al. 2023) TaxID=2972489 RepID=A0ABT1YRD6_9BACL|nr:hypothetical protein [Paenibacillus radicis (ex Xue et al. 2023)]MCR8634530.1 hypothetical protein [Paenibacillus radicis (ex Xue et al. 2023)]